MNIIDFLNDQDILWFPINLKLTKTGVMVNGEMKMKKELLPIKHPLYKSTKGYIPSYKDFETLDEEIIRNRQKLISKYDYIWVDTSQIYQIDIDTPKINDGLKRMIDQLPHYKSVSKSYGYHLFIDDETFKPYKNSYHLKEDKNIEILCGQGSYASKEVIVYNPEKKYLYNDMLNEVVFIPPKYEPQEEDMTEIKDFHISILNNINPDLYTHYKDWCRMVWACKFSFISGGLTMADRLSQKARGYKGFHDVKRIYDSANEKRIGWGYLMNLSKKSNKSRHYNIISENKNIGLDDQSLAEHAIMLLNDDVVKTKGIYYMYTDPYWVDCQDKKHKLKKKIMTLLRDYLQDRIRKIPEANPDDIKDIERVQEEIKYLDKIIMKTCQASGQRSIFEVFETIFEENDEIDFDTYKPYYFCFKNRAFNLETNKEVQIKKTDYITQTTGYNHKYIEDTTEMHNLFCQIFPDEEKRICYISGLRCSMIGLQYHNFIIANGNGGNGKSLINSLHATTMGDQYFYNGNITTITRKKEAGACPEIANMHKKRMVLFEEPNDSDALNIGTIKALTGNPQVNARQLYSKETKTTLQLTMFLECNKKPKINGRIDDSIIRRFVDIPFESTFTRRADLLKLKNYYKANPYYVTDEFRQEAKHALFQYLLTYDYTDIVISQSIQDHTNEYYYENDIFTATMDGLYEITDNEDDIVKLADMYDRYKETFYTENTRKYKTYTRKHFIREIQENIKWKHIYAQKFIKRRQTGGKSYKNVFIGMKERDEE